jgi:hypothetical protein
LLTTGRSWQASWPLANRAFEQVSNGTGELMQMRSIVQLSNAQK